MKKIFYIIASAIVALGAVACQNDIEEGIKPENKGEGVSFTAEIADLTRVAVEDSDDANYDKMLAWEGNETIVANYDSKEWEFTNTTADPYTFTCKADGAEELLGKAISLEYNHDNHYEAHANGSAQTIILSGQTTDLGNAPVVFTHVGGGLILHFTCAEETVIKWYGTNDNIGYYNGWGKEHTFAAGEHYISVEGGGLNMTLEAWIDDVKIKSISRTFDAGKIYNLGTIKQPTMWLRGSWDAGWNEFINMFQEGNLHIARNVTFEANTEFKICADKNWTKSYGSTTKDTAVATNMWHSVGDNNILVAEAGTYDIYFNGSAYCIVSSELEMPQEPSNWAIIGSFAQSGWTDVTMYKDGAYAVAYDITLKATDQVKFRKNSSWDNALQRTCCSAFTTNTITYLKHDGSDSPKCNLEGTFDIYIPEANAGYVIVVEANQPLPNTINTQTISLIGDAVGGWNAENDIVLTWDKESSLFSVKNTTVNAGKIKIRADKDWTHSWGSATTLKSGKNEIWYNGSDSTIAAGTYDFYTDLKYWWVMAIGQTPEL